MSEQALGRMRTVELPDLKPGMKLARAAITEKKQIIFTRGTTLNEGKIKILRGSYIRYVHIYDDGTWNLPSELVYGESAPDESNGAELTVDGLLGTSLELFNTLNRERKISAETLNKVGDELFARIHEKPVFSVLLDSDAQANYLFNHMVNVATLSTTIGRSMSLATQDLWDLFVGALLADVGMMQIREDLWLSNKKLSDMQRAEIQRHTEFGYKAILRVKDVDPVWALPALEHHERIDGSGYPDGKSREEIHAYSRIVAVADVYDALLSRRQWRGGMFPDMVMKHLLSAPREFDRDVVIKLGQTIGFYPVGCTVQLSDGRLAMVRMLNQQAPLNPAVDVLLGQGKMEQVDLSQVPNLTIKNIVARPKPS